MTFVMSWPAYSIIVMVGWGFWGFFSTLASRSMGSYEAVVYSFLGSSVVVVAMVLRKGFPSSVGTGGAIAAFLVGVIATLSFVPYVIALSKGKAAIVVPLVALYPIVTIFLSFLFLHETLTVRQFFGVVLAMLAVVLLSRA